MRLHAQPLNKGRIAILGDSIAYAGRWANEVENALKADKKFAACEIVNFSVPSETVAGLSEYGHAALCRRLTRRVFKRTRKGISALKRLPTRQKRRLSSLLPHCSGGIPLNRLSTTRYWTSTQNDWFLKEKMAGKSSISVPDFGNSLPGRRPGIPGSGIPVTACTPARKGIT